MTHIARTRRLIAVVGMTAVLPLAAACSSATAPSTATGAAVSSSASSAASSATTEAATEAAGDYCDVLKSAQQELEGLSGTLTDAMSKMEAAGATIQAHAKSACNLSLQ